MKKTRVIVLTSSFPRNDADWWAQFVLNIYKDLPQKIYEVTIFAPHAPNAKLKETFERVNVIRFPYFYPYRYEKLTSGEGIIHNKGDILSKFQILLFLIAEFLFFFIHLLRNRYDVIHAHWILPQGLIAVLMKWIFHLPVIVTVHGSDIFGLQALNGLKAFVLRNVDICTVNSEATYQAAQQLYCAAPLVLIPMGVDTHTFYPGRHQGETSRKTILAVGRLIRCKGYRYLIKALPLVLKKISNIIVEIVGSGPEEANLRALVNKLGLEQQVIFYGNLRHKELAEMYRESDLFVSPAVTDSVTGEKEAQGLAIIEAMASGLPVLATKSGGIKYIIKNRVTGILVQEKNYKELADKIILLLQDKKLSKQLGDEARKEVSKAYGWKTISEKFADIFYNLTKL